MTNIDLKHTTKAQLYEMLCAAEYDKEQLRAELASVAQCREEERKSFAE